jgi:arylsulfatase A-like enzyme
LADFSLFSKIGYNWDLVFDLQLGAMMKKLIFSLFCLTLINLGLSPFSLGSDTNDAPPNILFIAIDDMNDWVGFLGGHPQAKTPKMDKLAKRGVNFTNAHCIAPACSPCRLGLLYGIEPFHSGLYPFYDHDQIEKEVLSKYTSLPKLFRDNGYQSFGAGKIFHGSKNSAADWNDYHQHNGPKLKYAPENGYQQGNSQKMAFCPTTNPLEEHPDYQVASYGIDILSRQHDKPFFLAVGIVKPHLAFVCPQTFFDMHAGPIEKPLIRHRDLQDVPWVGRSMTKLGDDLKFRNDDAWENVRRSYLACISWADYNVGRVLEALEKSPYADNTIIVLWSDHGYHLGEKRSFRKFSLWEEATRVPFIIADPRPGRSKPGNCSEAVSLINVYRTLTDLAGIEAPDYVDGKSLASQINDPVSPIDEPAITTWGRGNYTIRDDHWRYTRYFDGGEELYNHSSDPQEWNNLIGDQTLVSRKNELAAFLPKTEAPLVKIGISLDNVIDADKPEKLEKFKNQTWPGMKKKLKPAIE